MIGGALVFILNTRAAPPEPTYQQLATLALSVNLSDVLDAAGFNRIFPTRADFTNLTSALTEIAQEQQVRILLVNVANQNVLYDSAGDFQTNQIRSAGRWKPTTSRWRSRATCSRASTPFAARSDRE